MSLTQLCLSVSGIINKPFGEMAGVWRVMLICAILGNFQPETVDGKLLYLSIFWYVLP